MSRDIDYEDLFLDGALEDCPKCGEKQLVPPYSWAASFRVCLNCGVVPLPDGPP